MSRITSNSISIPDYLLPKDINMSDCETIFNIVNSSLEEFKLRSLKECNEDQINEIFESCKSKKLLLKLDSNKLLSMTDFIRDYIHIIYSTYDFIIKSKEYNLKIDVKEGE